MVLHIVLYSWFMLVSLPVPMFIGPVALVSAAFVVASATSST